ncbi:uncharacterized protein LOC123535137 isoform X3 [Mercenaria mercenaria]|uniref:uncharacterized protein LOC123535137 isoform X3 n=1 Tax=Mercenaria mercenaria TaxID=6596 RepID=UPI00234EE765|nr:uncharacterized protein LOC123535137 isoform X3 [Mercenaria mercenaria]
MEENIDSGGKETVEKVAEHHEDDGIDEGPEVVHKRLLKRARQRRLPKRPMYDATNTSTNMILLNNKYGKYSRLWKNQENQLDRGSLINPQRHLKEPSFYLSGNFHSRCSTSESSLRRLPVTNLKFDFSDRPHSDKIGDRLYEARMSVNQHRHRSCQCSLPTLPKPLDFSPLTKQERSNRYVFAWERLYAEPLARPSTSVRPVSELSGKKIGTPAIKIPHAMLALPIKETI